MGYLHDGHLALVEGAKRFADVVVVSIYVNPTQFSVNEDFDVYPRDVEGDREKLRRAGVDAVFEPSSLYEAAPSSSATSFVVGTGEFIPGGHETYVQVEQLQKVLCGVSRPHFFRGVATVCAKLFNIVEPDVAVFGKKDYQQWRIISTMVRDLDFGVEVVGMPLVREPDGLAMSSRNVRLSPDERQRALCISRGLRTAREAIEGGAQMSPAEVQRDIAGAIQSAGGAVDYVEVLDADNLSPVSGFAAQDTLIAVAAKFGSVRLIDNTVVRAK